MANDDSTEPGFSDREQHILRVLVDQYITDGQPVGSRTLSKLPGIDISAASVRNVMGDLELMGLLKSPHTSAGRVPTSAAYRIFVDQLLEVKKLGPDTISDLRTALDPTLSDQGLIKVATSQLSAFTRMAGMVTAPKRDSLPLRQVEFLPLSDQRVLAILIQSNNEIQNRVIPVERDYSKRELEEIANYLNAEFLGQPLASIRDAVHQELNSARDDMGDRMKLMIDIAGQAFSPDEVEADEIKDELVVSGETNLMAHEDLSSVDILRDLFEAFQRKRDIYHLLERCISADGVQIFIGQEAGYDVLEECSLVTAPYEANGEVMGVLAVVGPKRMAYDKVIPLVDVTSRLLSAALNSPRE